MRETPSACRAGKYTFYPGACSPSGATACEQPSARRTCRFRRCPFWQTEVGAHAPPTRHPTAWMDGQPAIVSGHRSARDDEPQAKKEVRAEGSHLRGAGRQGLLLDLNDSKHPPFSWLKERRWTRWADADVTRHFKLPARRATSVLRLQLVDGIRAGVHQRTQDRPAAVRDQRRLRRHGAIRPPRRRPRHSRQNLCTPSPQHV